MARHADPRHLTSKAMKLIGKRLRHLEKVPTDRWTIGNSEEVTGYLRALRGATKEVEEPTLKRARELRKVPTPELKKLVEGVDDDAEG